MELKNLKSINYNRVHFYNTYSNILQTFSLKIYMDVYQVLYRNIRDQLLYSNIPKTQNFKNS